MSCLIPFSRAQQMAQEKLGGKALTLARLHQAGYPVPEGFCLPIEVYRDFLASTGLADFIAMELQRKDFVEMRWEEVWDVSLRVRNHFVTAAWPAAMHRTLLEELRQGPGRWEAVAVRSTAPGEDAARQSFAGLHQSLVLVHGAEAILEAIRVVWASLWSDGALLYRQELGLDPAESGMAVVVQQMVVGEVSGVMFTQAPHDATRMVIEAVWGLNQALVDGTLEPDRWQLDRAQGTVVEKHEVHHTVALRPSAQGPELVTLAADQRFRSPLDESLCARLFRVGQQLEAELNAPVDIEWTTREDRLYILQARPITTALQTAQADERPRLLSLHRSLPTLERLRADLEEHVLPGMTSDAAKMASVDPGGLDDASLATEVRRRRKLLQKWLLTYREKCIPMAHGIRLFAEHYNDIMRPEDPYAFMDLLRCDALLAVERNRQLLAMAALVRDDPALRAYLQEGGAPVDAGPLRTMVDAFQERFGNVHWIAQGEFNLSSWLLKLADEFTFRSAPPERPGAQEDTFLNSLAQNERALAARLLALARASYALRDNDNIYLGKIRSGVLAAEQEARRRLQDGTPDVLRAVLSEATDPSALFAERKAVEAAAADQGPAIRFARQMVGQPASPGVDSGVARVLHGSSDLRNFRAGEILVCDAIEPNMTFLVPLAAAIVERRGGMLIHGAIIAREYGIPCVTGIHAATQAIHSGDVVTVDGYLGIVTIDHQER